MAASWSELSDGGFLLSPSKYLKEGRSSFIRRSRLFILVLLSPVFHEVHLCVPTEQSTQSNRVDGTIRSAEFILQVLPAIFISRWSGYLEVKMINSQVEDWSTP